jgi:CubicO group peptidase (beta-lactamase class C family)
MSDSLRRAAKGAIPGAVLVVARDGKVVHLQALGYRDREKSVPMKPDAICRIASMTKPVTSVAVMMLAEEGKIDLLAPVSQNLPEFRDVKVGVEKTDPTSSKPVLLLEDLQRLNDGAGSAQTYLWAGLRGQLDLARIRIRTKSRARG